MERSRAKEAHQGISLSFKSWASLELVSVLSCLPRAHMSSKSLPYYYHKGLVQVGLMCSAIVQCFFYWICTLLLFHSEITMRGTSRIEAIKSLATTLDEDNSRIEARISVQYNAWPVGLNSMVVPYLEGVILLILSVCQNSLLSSNFCQYVAL